MKSSIRDSISKTIFGICLLSLGGCVSGLKLTDINVPESKKTSEQTMSIDEILANAREQESVQKTKTDLYLLFEPDRHTLNSNDEQQLLEFAKQEPTHIYMACALSRNQDRFAAAAAAINRCQNISTFLSLYHFNSDILLSPHLQTDQVRVYR
ncbi:hypothetical protein [Neptuniibacter sp.]|uniref:hypothetical protein n=1 Tax=Neptuniibacter sp. TaxID=1962643 RepID=UPI003B5C8549